MGAGSTQNGDTPEGASVFAQSYGLAGSGVTMIYDTSFQSWIQFGVISQPYWILFDAAGNIVASQGGAVNFASVESVL